ncbi:hypothetical protein [Chondromyces crocatus]|uniref:Bacteriophage Mx8 p63 C-terminal domain-containing protein n=1 Tax=Chondromyces crocatus TaxID=52 RepID=A0A0K1EG69_CHOCO|nr:hypothetical protein [Chondromyces crocatus]AKT39558.1 uncharacterized protein CMC5_037050 [Chondromyces crocatus]
MLTLGDHDVECHVLSDGRRVLATSQVEHLLGAAKKRDLSRSLARIPNEYGHMSVPPRILFVLGKGSTAYGYEGRSVIDICLAYQSAFLAGSLHHSQERIARKAMSLVGSCAKVGIEAFIDEATGYQSMRPGDYIQRRVEQFLREYRDEWKPRWDQGSVTAFCRLYRKRVSPNPKFMQPVAGRIYDIVIGPHVMAILRQRNPTPQKGTNHHQYFREAVQAQFEKELAVIAGLAETSNSVKQFWHKMGVRYLGHPLQTEFWD